MSLQANEVVAFRTPPPLHAVQGTLALDLQPILDPPPAPVVRLDDLRKRRSVEAWVRRYAQAAMEIVGGDRPASQLLRHSSKEVYADLHRRALLVARSVGQQPAVGRLQAVRPRVASVRVAQLEDGVAECCIRVEYGPRSRAVAARFKEVETRWVCTALDFS